jgi:hypothetical protein
METAYLAIYLMDVYLSKYQNESSLDFLIEASFLIASKFVEVRIFILIWDLPSFIKILLWLTGRCNKKRKWDPEVRRILVNLPQCAYLGLVLRREARLDR